MAFPVMPLMPLQQCQYCNNGTLVSKTKCHTHTHTHSHTHRRALRCKEAKNANNSTEFPLGLSALLNFDQRLDWLCE
jgi:hypothetical protein